MIEAMAEGDNLEMLVEKVMELVRNGLTKASGIVDALDDKEYTGSLVTLLQDGTDFVRNNSKMAWRKVGTA